MPSPNIKKTNIESVAKALVRQQANAEGLSMTKLLSKMVYFYMQHKEEENAKSD